MSRWFLRSALAIGALLILASAFTLAYRGLRQSEIARANRIAIPPGVDSLEKIELGGATQWIQIRGRDRALPLLLMLHGGPGFPEMLRIR